MTYERGCGGMRLGAGASRSPLSGGGTPAKVGAHLFAVNILHNIDGPMAWVTAVAAQRDQERRDQASAFRATAKMRRKGKTVPCGAGG